MVTKIPVRPSAHSYISAHAPGVSDLIPEIYEEYNSKNGTFSLLARLSSKFVWSSLIVCFSNPTSAHIIISHIFDTKFTYYINLNNLLELFYWGLWSGGDDFGSENAEHIDEKLKKVSSCPPFWTSFWPFEKTLTFKKVRTTFRSLELEKTVRVFWASLTELGRQIVHDHFFRARATEKVL